MNIIKLRSRLRINAYIANERDNLTTESQMIFQNVDLGLYLDAF